MSVRTLVDLFFPPLCLLCDAPLERPARPEVCDACRAAFPRVPPASCDRCGAPAAGGAAPPAPCRHCRGWQALSGARTPFLYAGGVRAWVRQLKYGGLEELATLGAEPLRDALAGLPHAHDVSALVPVPLHRVRRRERGFNQSDRLAAALGLAAGLPTLEVLARARPTPSQAALPAAARAANVAGAFVARAAHVPFCRSRNLVLVDDVLTTGTTLDAAAAALLAGGAARVGAVALARALPGGDA